MLYLAILLVLMNLSCDNENHLPNQNEQQHQHNQNSQNNKSTRIKNKTDLVIALSNTSSDTEIKKLIEDTVAAKINIDGFLSSILLSKDADKEKKFYIAAKALSAKDLKKEVELKTSHGNTILHFPAASKTLSYETLTELWKTGIDPNLKNDDGDVIIDDPQAPKISTFKSRVAQAWLIFQAQTEPLKLIDIIKAILKAPSFSGLLESELDFLKAFLTETSSAELRKWVQWLFLEIYTMKDNISKLADATAGLDLSAKHPNNHQTILHRILVKDINFGTTYWGLGTQVLSNDTSMIVQAIIAQRPELKNLKANINLKLKKEFNVDIALNLPNVTPYEMISEIITNLAPNGTGYFVNLAQKEKDKLIAMQQILKP